jgi:hypothetical protein
MLMMLIIGGKHTNTESLVVVRKKSCLEVLALKTNYIVISRCQQERRNHNIQAGNKSSERMKQFKYMGKDLKIKLHS